MKKKILSSSTLVTLLVISMFSSMFVVSVNAIDYPTVRPDNPNTYGESHTRGEGHSVLVGGVSLICPEPIIGNYTDDVVGHWIVCYHGQVVGPYNGILAGSVGRVAWFAWCLTENGTYSATVTFDCWIKWKLDDGNWMSMLRYNAGTCTVTITVGDGNNTNDTGNNTCFLAGTKILMDDLSVKNIEQIQRGDVVKSISMTTGEIESDRVVELKSHSPDEMEDGYLEIGVDKGLTVNVTPNHPIMVIENDFRALQDSSDPNVFNDGCEFAFIKAGDLKVGDKMFGRTVTSITEYPEAQEWSYDLVLENNLNYIVVDTPSSSYEGDGFSIGGRIALEDGWIKVGDQEYLPTIAPGVKGNSASAVYIEGIEIFGLTNVAIYALPMLQPMIEG